MRHEPGEITPATGSGSGIAQRRAGSVTHSGEDITALRGHQLVARGIGYVPQLENVFAQLTVKENLQTGVFLAPDRWQQAASLDEVVVGPATASEIRWMQHAR